MTFKPAEQIGAHLLLVLQHQINNHQRQVIFFPKI